MKANETKKQFMDRLDVNVQNALNKAMMDTKKIRSKRKQHLKARDEKKKKAIKDKQQSRTLDFHHLKDNHSFGDVAMQPPELSALPRKAAKSSSNSKNLKLSSLLGQNSSIKANELNDRTERPTKKRKHMTNKEKREFDVNRQNAIDSYRLMKKDKEG